jgi:hypothetical protein
VVEFKEYLYLFWCSIFADLEEDRELFEFNLEYIFLVDFKYLDNLNKFSPKIIISMSE